MFPHRHQNEEESDVPPPPPPPPLKEDDDWKRLMRLQNSMTASIRGKRKAKKPSESTDSPKSNPVVSPPNNTRKDRKKQKEEQEEQPPHAYSKYPRLGTPLMPGYRIAYRILEIGNETWTPELSDHKVRSLVFFSIMLGVSCLSSSGSQEAEVLSMDHRTNQVLLRQIKPLNAPSLYVSMNAMLEECSTERIVLTRGEEFTCDASLLQDVHILDQSAATVIAASH